MLLLGWHPVEMSLSFENRLLCVEILARGLTLSAVGLIFEPSSLAFGGLLLGLCQQQEICRLVLPLVALGRWGQLNSQACISTIDSISSEPGVGRREDDGSTQAEVCMIPKLRAASLGVIKLSVRKLSFIYNCFL